MGQQQENIKAIFDEAAEFPSPEQRTAYLDRACVGNLKLREKVQGLLDALDRSGSFLESPPAAALATTVVREAVM